MILVDTSVWVDHLFKNDAGMARLLKDGEVIMHPLIIGELSMGHLSPRAAVLNSLKTMPMIRQADDLEVWHTVETHRLYNSGIGYIDAHLLAATLLTPGTSLWTRDKRLRQTATHLGLAAIHLA